MVAVSLVIMASRMAKVAGSSVGVEGVFSRISDAELSLSSSMGVVDVCCLLLFLVLGFVVADGSLVPFFVVDIQMSRKDCRKLEKNLTQSKI